MCSFNSAQQILGFKKYNVWTKAQIWNDRIKPIKPQWDHGPLYPKIYTFYIYLFSCHLLKQQPLWISVVVRLHQSTGISSKRASNTRMFSLLKKRGKKKGKKKKVYLVVLIILILNTNALSSISTSSFYFWLDDFIMCNLIVMADAGPHFPTESQN